MSSTYKFLLQLLVFSIVTWMIIFMIDRFLFSPEFVYIPWPLIQLFMVFITIGFHFGLSRAGAGGNAAFIRFFMGATAGKLFLFMMIMILFSLFNKDQAVPFIIHFFILYLFYTCFEVAVVYRQLTASKTK